MGRLPYGYVKYHATFEHRGEQKLFLETHTKDPKQIFLNGKRIPDLSTPEKNVSCTLDEWAKQGSNLLEISYEAFGSESGNAEMSELKGLISICTGDEQKAPSIDTVSIQRYLAAREPAEFCYSGSGL